MHRLRILRWSAIAPAIALSAALVAPTAFAQSPAFDSPVVSP